MGNKHKTLIDFIALSVLLHSSRYISRTLDSR